MKDVRILVAAIELLLQCLCHVDVLAYGQCTYQPGTHMPSYKWAEHMQYHLPVKR